MFACLVGGLGIAAMTHLLTAKGVERRPPIRASPLQTGHTVCRSLKRVALSFLSLAQALWIAARWASD
jgi:hypothetical protein